MKRNDKKAMTLVEILITVFILTVGILASLLYFTQALASTEMARDITVATMHAEQVFEEMHSKAALTDITSENWTTWAGANGLNTLPDETVNVTYVDSMADPLQINVSVSWIRKERTQTTTLDTEMTK